MDFVIMNAHKCSKILQRKLEFFTSFSGDSSNSFGVKFISWRRPFAQWCDYNNQNALSVLLCISTRLLEKHSGSSSHITLSNVIMQMAYSSKVYIS